MTTSTMVEAFISLVITTTGKQPLQRDALQRMLDVLSSNFTDYEIVVIANEKKMGDGWTSEVESLLGELPCIRYIQLATEVDSDVAWAAGLENAIGDFVILFDYLHDPVDSIPVLVKACMAGDDIIVGVSHRKQTLMYRFVRLFMTIPLRAIGYNLPQNATSLRCLSRRAVNTVTSTRRFQHQLFLRIQRTGYRFSTFSYEKKQGGDETPKSFFRGLRYFLHLLVFNSSKPLRWVSALGFMGSGLAFVFASFSVILHLFRGNIVQGWTTTVFFMSFFFMLQFIMVSFLGEYMRRLLDDRSEQEAYSVAFEKNSLVMIDAKRINVLGDSVGSPNLVQTGRNK